VIQQDPNEAETRPGPVEDKGRGIAPRKPPRHWVHTLFLGSAIILAALGGLTAAYLLHANAEQERLEQAQTIRQLQEIGRIAQNNMRAQIQVNADVPFRATRLEAIENRLRSLEDRVRALEEENERLEGQRR